MCTVQLAFCNYTKKKVEFIFQLHLFCAIMHDCDNQAQDGRVQIVQKVDIPTAL